MSYGRIVLVLAAAGLIFFLTGAWHHHSAQSVSATPIALLATPPASAEATRVLERAIANWRSEKVIWLQARLRQKMACAEFHYQSEGTYLSGPDNRLRLDLTLRLGHTIGKMLVVNDGTTLWRRVQVANEQPTLTRVDVQKVLEALADPKHAVQANNDLVRAQFLAGVAPLLQSLRRRMIVTRQDTGSWNKCNYVRLTLHWTPAIAKKFMAADNTWPADLPCKCLVYLNAATLWPERFEWWCPGNGSASERQIFQMELLDPIINRPPAGQTTEQVFQFDPGKFEVPDQTPLFTNMIAKKGR